MCVYVLHNVTSIYIRCIAVLLCLVDCIVAMFDILRSDDVRHNAMTCLSKSIYVPHIATFGNVCYITMFAYLLHISTFGSVCHIVT
jgi:hypothetical protein